MLFVAVIVATGLPIEVCAALARLPLQKGSAPSPVIAVDQRPIGTPPTRQIIEQKLNLLVALLKSPQISSVAGSDDAAVRDLLGNVRAMIDDSRSALATGDLAKANDFADGAMRNVSRLRAMSPGSKDSRVGEYLRDDYQKRRAQLESLRQGLMDTMEKGSVENVSNNLDRIDRLSGEAEHLAHSGDFRTAISKIADARRLVVDTISSFRQHETVVYELNFKNPKTEFDYELRRNQGYEELVRVVIDKRGTSNADGRLLQVLEKNRASVEQATSLADKDDFPAAIKILEAANADLSRALPTVGVQ